MATPNPLISPPFGGALFFAANDGTDGTQLWKTDGTPGGTAEVTVITGPFGTNPYVSDLTAAGGTLFFAAARGLCRQRRDRRGHRPAVSGAAGVTLPDPVQRQVFFSGLDPANSSSSC